MREFYTQTLKYFHLAISEFLPTLEEIRNTAHSRSIKEEVEDLIEAYDDIDAKIKKHNLNYEDPNRGYDGEPWDIKMDIPDPMIENLARLTRRLLQSWKDKLDRLKKKTYLTDSNKDEIYRLENLIWPLEAMCKEGSSILGKHGSKGPLIFPGEKNDSPLQLLLSEIHRCYELGDQELLESKKLGEVESRIQSEMPSIISELNNEVFDLKLKKINGGWKTVLKPGFHNRKTAEAKLGAWEALIKEILDDDRSSADKKVLSSKQSSDEIVKTIKNRLKTEDLFVESRSQGEDQHLLIGKRDGNPEKAHLIVDGKTGEIRVEDNQQEPTELIQKIESVLTLRSGKKIRTTREAIEELPNSEQRPRIDLVSNFSVSGSSEGNFIQFQVKNDGSVTALDIQAELVADGDVSAGKIDVTHNLSPQKESGAIGYRYTDTAFFQKELNNPRIIFTYRAANGESFSSGRRIIQVPRADGQFNIHSRPGEYFEG